MIDGFTFILILGALAVLYYLIKSAVEQGVLNALRKYDKEKSKL